VVFHGTMIALHEKPEFLTLNKSKIRTFIQGNELCHEKLQLDAYNYYSDFNFSDDFLKNTYSTFLLYLDSPTIAPLAMT